MTKTERHDCAVAFCVDRNFLPFALFMVRQIAFHNPVRQFDFVIATQDRFDLPQWAQSLDIKVHVMGSLPDLPLPARFRGSMATYLRILLPGELRSRYRRILYLDADMFVEGGDFNRILQADLGPHPLAGTYDAPTFYKPNFHAREFAAAGLPVLPYMNTGTLLFDTRACHDQDLARRIFAALDGRPKGYHLADQSLINLALRGKFAVLSPAWNWQLSGRLPLVTLKYPVFLRHLIGTKKPNNDSGDPRDARFRQAYEDHFRSFDPEELARLAPPGDPMPITLGRAAKLVMWHIQSQALVATLIGRFKSPYDVLV